MGSLGRLQVWRPLLRWGAGVGVAAILAAGPVIARDARERPLSVDAVALSSLPAEAQTVHRTILSGGPFAYPKDGIVFANRERLLPSEPRGYYREYTVQTAGARVRGARRIVCGGRSPTRPSACYYTADHYSSFRQITP